MILHFIIRCAAALAIPGLTKDKLPDLVIHHSVSRAWRLGEAVLRARCDHADPISTILEHSNGNLIFMGKVRQNKQTNKQTNNNEQTHKQQNKTKQNKTKQNKTKQNKTKQNKTKQNKTKRSEAKRNETKRNETKRNKTKQNKTK